MGEASVDRSAREQGSGYFVHACSEFIYIENLIALPAAKPDEPALSTMRTALDESVKVLLRTAVDHTTDDDGWSHLCKVGVYVSNKSSFSPVNHGFHKLSDVLRASELFDIEMRNDKTAMYVRPRRVEQKRTRLDTSK